MTNYWPLDMNHVLNNYLLQILFYQGIHEDQNHDQNLNKNHPDTLQAAFVAVRFWCLLAVITS